MAYEQKAGSGSLFRNDKKGNEKAPDYKGSGKDLQGNEIWLSGWVRKSEKGTQYLSISMQPKEPKAAEIFNAEGYKEPIEQSNDLPW